MAVSSSAKPTTKAAKSVIPPESEVVEVETTETLPAIIPAEVVSVFPSDPTEALGYAKTIIQQVSDLVEKQDRGKFIATIPAKGKRPETRYPMAAWWTAVGPAVRDDKAQSKLKQGG